ncbi:MAG: HAD family hydrolase, partial [Streptococcus suis]
DGRAHFDPVTHKILKPNDWEERFAPERKIEVELKRQMKGLDH